MKAPHLILLVAGVLLTSGLHAEGDRLWVALGTAGGESREGWRESVCGAYGLSGIQAVQEKKRSFESGVAEEFRFGTGEVVRVTVRESDVTRYLIDVQMESPTRGSVDATIRLGRNVRFVVLDDSRVLVMEIR